MQFRQIPASAAASLMYVQPIL